MAYLASFEDYKELMDAGSGYRYCDGCQRKEGELKESERLVKIHATGEFYCSSCFHGR